MEPAAPLSFRAVMQPRHARGLLLALSSVLFGSAAAQPLAAEETTTLTDCTESYSLKFDIQLPEWWDYDLDEVLEASTSWALESCYLPCSYPMCVAVTAVTNSYVVAYVTWDSRVANESTAASENPELLTVTIGPEAELVISREDFSVVHSTIYHSGCRSAESDCDWESVLER